MDGKRSLNSQDILKFALLQTPSDTATTAKLSVNGYKLGSLAGHGHGEPWELALPHGGQGLPWGWQRSCQYQGISPAGLGPEEAKKSPRFPAKKKKRETAFSPSGCLKPQQLLLALKPAAAGTASFSDREQTRLRRVIFT